jgi:ribosome-associated translation inhibitor RaiA
MQTSITARHCEISDDLRARTHDALVRLGGLLSAPVEGTVVFDAQPQRAVAEIRLRGGRGELFLATGEDRDHRSALDRAVEKIRRQVDREGRAKHGRGPREPA